jgi:murein DD-endopeptidase MepM/ murein hydrolase activator NlpD
MSNQIYELLPQLFTESEIMILDFNQILSSTPEYKNIKAFFEKSRSLGIDPKLPENRQKFNNEFLQKTGKKYLISSYAEDRIEMLKGSRIAQERRTIHLGVDIFSKDLESVYAPSDGEIIVADREGGSHSFGNYLILKLDPKITKYFLFLGHLSKDLPHLGKVFGGQIIAKLGDYLDGENGGWSRHLHVQLLKDLPASNSFIPGYSSNEKLKQNMIEYPDPSFLVLR